MAEDEKARIDPRIEGLRTRALEQIQILEDSRRAAAVEDSVRVELARARLEVADSVRSFNRAIDTLMSW